jgi:hypothetical protein
MIIMIYTYCKQQEERKGKETTFTHTIQISIDTNSIYL